MFSSTIFKNRYDCRSKNRKLKYIIHWQQQLNDIVQSKAHRDLERL